jgi:hypothetical protein
MQAIDKIAYSPLFVEGCRVRLVKVDHSQIGKSAVVVRALPNPSQLEKHQWYDVRFDNGRYGRFLSRYLEPVGN